MDKFEFLEKLKEALVQDLNPQAVQENLNYYSQYISDEAQGGMSEQQVVDSLGDPWMIARTIIDTQSTQGQSEYVYESPRPSQEQRKTTGGSLRVFGLDTWWKKLLVILCIVGVICVIFAIVSGIVSLVAPILIPVLVILIVMRLIKGKR